MARIKIDAEKAWWGMADRDGQGDTGGASTQREFADGIVVFLAYVLVGLGVLVGTQLAARSTLEIDIQPMEGIAAFAVFYILAAVVERLMEPIAEVKIPGGKKQQKTDQPVWFSGLGSYKRVREARRDAKYFEALGEPDREKSGERAKEAANEDAQSKAIAANTKVAVWAVAAFVTMLVSGAMKLYLLPAVGVTIEADWLNVLITGLAISAGTEPLHQLIEKFKKENEDPPPDEDSGDGES